MCVEVEMKFSFFVTVVFSLIIIACATASNPVESSPPVTAMTKSLNAQKYGDEVPKVWTPLTPIEMGALIKAKTEFDDEAKMIISLLLTSDIREGEEIAAAVNAYREFIALCDKELSTIKDAKEKGKKLHALFFKQFIGTMRKKESENSGIAGILLKKEYDTNTAAMLFAIIAQKYGFAPDISFTKGRENELLNRNTGLSVKISSGKAYIALKHRDMFSPVQVFSFLENGYDPYVNLGFFENLKNLFPDEFDDPGTEFKKYYRRESVFFEEKLLLQYKIDRINENADTEDAPIHRRIEMAAFLTDSCEILLDRVWAWRNIYTFILGKKIPGEMLVFIDTINPELNRTAELCGSETGFDELAWELFLFSSFEYANSLDGKKLKDALIKGYQFLSTSAKNYENKKGFLANALNYYLNKVIQTGVIEKELVNVKSAIGAIPVTEIRTEAASSFYYQAGEYYLKSKNNWRAAEFYAECAFVYGGQYQNTCIQKSVDLLYKYAVDSLNRGVCATASDARNKCLEKIPDKNECKKIIDLYNQKCGK